MLYFVPAEKISKQVDIDSFDELNCIFNDVNQNLMQYMLIKTNNDQHFLAYRSIDKNLYILRRANPSNLFHGKYAYFKPPYIYNNNTYASSSFQELFESASDDERASLAYFINKGAQ